jgi:hypothetical protein
MFKGKTTEGIREAPRTRTSQLGLVRDRETVEGDIFRMAVPIFRRNGE